jgi:hypothetical protein
MASTNQNAASPRRARVVAGTAVVIVAIAMITLGLREKPQSGVVGATDSTTVIAGGPFEPSGVVHVPGTNYLLFVDDGRAREILLMELGGDGKQVGAAVPVALNADVTDPEGITTDGKYFYVVGSQSKKSGFEGDGLVRFTFNVTSRRVENVERIQGLKAWLAASVPELAGTAKKIGDEVLNVEGLAWDPVGNRLLLGLRTPQAGGDALVLPIKLVDAAGAFSRENLRFDGPTIRLNLGGAGIRGLEYDAARKTFLVIAGAGLDTESRDFQLSAWSGESAASPGSSLTYSRDLKPEGFTRAIISGRSMSVIVFDVGRYSVRD